MILIRAAFLIASQREQREMLHLEEERQRQEKLQSQESRRRLLDQSLRLKMKRLAQQQQDELALDMSILEQLLAEERDEKQGEATRKVSHEKFECKKN